MKNIIIVTGGAGFIGSNLISYLIKKTKFRIISIDNYSTGTIKNHIIEKNVKYIKSENINISKILRLYKKNYSIALMIDQRVSQGIKSRFFDEEAFTTTIPAQFIKKFNCKLVPISIERHNGVNFNIKIEKPMVFSKDSSTEKITRELNIWLEKAILKNPGQWIWSHDRWK